MKKRVCAMAAVLVLVLSISANAAARVPISAPTLSFSGTTAKCSFLLIAQGKDIEANITLFHMDGDVKISVGYWPNLSATGTLRFAETCTVKKGEQYELRVECTIDGVKQPAVSTMKTC